MNISLQLTGKTGKLAANRLQLTGKKKLRTVLAN